jgi:hypothetical protein
MRILFHNYSNEITTEPLYLFQALQKSGIDSHVWNNPNESAFDTFDKVQPDVFVSSFRTVTPDILKYLKQNPKIDLVLNVTGCSAAQMNGVEEALKFNNIKSPFVFVNSFEYKPLQKTSLKCERIYPAFDLFRIAPKQNEPICKEAILSVSYDNHLEEQLASKEVYHLIQVTDGEKGEEFDLRSNVSSVQGLSQYYKSFSLVGDTDFCSSQLFFDLNFNANNISVNVEDKENFDKFLSSIFKDDGSSVREISSQIKQQLKARHTPFHRASTFMKHLKDKDGAIQVDTVKNQLPELLKDL